MTHFKDGGRVRIQNDRKNRISLGKQPYFLVGIKNKAHFQTDVLFKNICCYNGSAELCFTSTVTSHATSFERQRYMNKKLGAISLGAINENENKFVAAAQFGIGKSSSE